MSSIAKDEFPKTIPEATQDFIKQQIKDWTFTQVVDTYWNPTHIAEFHKTVAEMMPVTDSGWKDWRLRPMSHVYNQECKGPITKEAIAERQKYYVNAWNEKWNEYLKVKDDVNKKEAVNREVTTIEKHKSFWRNIEMNMMNWRPIRKVEFNTYTNYHKIDGILAKYNTDSALPLHKQICSVLIERKKVMDEMNKSRKNPMRNVHLNIAFTPAATFISASWDIHRENRDDGCYYTHYLHASQYNLGKFGDAEVVGDFKCLETLKQLEANAKEQRDKEIDKQRREEARKAKIDKAHLVKSGK